MKTNHWLILILVLAAALRLYGLSRGDTVNDEVFYGFRAVGMMDFDEAAEQTTPLEWLDPSTSSGQAPIPSWTKLSFHDHPPLVFWIQHFSIALFGENNFALRFPSALLGVLSVYLLYLIGQALYSPSAGLVGAAFMAATLNSVYISRVGMQESYVIFFLLLSIYFFLKSLRKENYLIWTGVALGFGLLTKYNVFILVPIFLTYLAFFRRDYFKSAGWRKKLGIGAVLALIIFSPVIVYNLKLYQTAGHFDFQFSYILGQNPEVWQIQPGKEIGTISDRIQNLIPRLIDSHSWLFLAIFAISLLAISKLSFVLITFIWLLLLLLLIGPSYRFLTVLTPFMALISAVFLARFDKKIFLVPIILFEIFYSINNQIAYYPVGASPWLSSKVRFENYNWGYNALGEFFASELKNKMPAIRFEAKYRFIEEKQDRSLELAKKRGFEPYPAMIVTYGNFDRGAKLWVLDRLHIYHGWPVIDLETYFNYLQENGFDYYRRVGFKHYYFILSANIVPSPEFQTLIQKTQFISIFNPRGEEVFKVYKI